MQTIRLVQAVALMMILALAASCAVSKQYTSKLFAPRTEPARDSQAIAIRFLDTDSADEKKEGWVSTDIIMGRDTSTGTAALDNLALVFPPKKTVTDSPVRAAQADSSAAMTITAKTAPVQEPAVAKTTVMANGTRTKRSRAEKP